MRLEATRALLGCWSRRARRPACSSRRSRAPTRRSATSARASTPASCRRTTCSSAQAQRARQEVRLIQARNDARGRRAGSRAADRRGAGDGPIDATTPRDRSAARPPALGAEPSHRPLDELVARAPGRAPAQRAGARALPACAQAPRRRRPRQAVRSPALAAVEPRGRTRGSFPRADALDTSWDLGVNVTWHVVGQRPRAAPRAPRRQRQADAARAAIARVRRRCSPLEVGSGCSISTRPRRARRPGDGVPRATEARRVVGERFAPASRPAPKCSTPRSRCSRPSSSGRALAGRAAARRGAARARGLGTLMADRASCVERRRSADPRRAL